MPIRLSPGLWEGHKKDASFFGLTEVGPAFSDLPAGEAAGGGKAAGKAGAELLP